MNESMVYVMGGAQRVFEFRLWEVRAGPRFYQLLVMQLPSLDGLQAGHKPLSRAQFPHCIESRFSRCPQSSASWGASAMPVDPLVRDTFLPWQELQGGLCPGASKCKGMDNPGACTATWSCTRSVAWWLVQRCALELLRPPAP